MAITLKQAVEIALKEFRESLTKEFFEEHPNETIGSTCTETKKGWYFDFEMDDDTAYFVSKEGIFELRGAGPLQSPEDLEVDPDDPVIKEDIDLSEYLYSRP